MIFLDLAYRVLSGPRGEANTEIAAKSGLLAHTLDQGYVAGQILAIRRLLDPRKDVISIRRLLKDIQRHRGLITREIYVGHDGLPYNPDSWLEFPETIENQIWGIEAPGLGNYLGSKTRHDRFDRLSGVAPSQRQRTDLIGEWIFEKLDQWLKTNPAEKLLTLGHKFFAHAADIGSRGSLEYSGVLLSDVAEIHRAIVRVERAITDEILFIGIARNVVPMEPLGFLKNFDKPYALTSSIPKMQGMWNSLVAERNQWPVGLSKDL
jgi:hypothetical protein